MELLRAGTGGVFCVGSNRVYRPLRMLDQLALPQHLSVLTGDRIDSLVGLANFLYRGISLNGLGVNPDGIRDGFSGGWALEQSPTIYDSNYLATNST